MLPILGWLRSYDHGWLRGDLIAGVTVASLIVPKNLGYAWIAGIPLQNGLYAAAAGTILYAIFGACRQGRGDHPEPAACRQRHHHRDGRPADRDHRDDRGPHCRRVVVVLTGAGDRAFSVGSDLRQRKNMTKEDCIGAFNDGREPTFQDSDF
ncbi:MAG: SulP family inorganic anion transporter [Dermatophilaceae bacterium]